MKRFITQLALLAAVAMLATGCAPTRHNLPPEQHLRQPGPGVGGPGPGVMGPPNYNLNRPPVSQPIGQPFGQPIGMMGMPISAKEPASEAASDPAGDEGGLQKPDSGVMQASFTGCGPGCQGCGTPGCVAGGRLRGAVAGALAGGGGHLGGGGGHFGGGLGSNIPPGGGVLPMGGDGIHLMAGGIGGGAPATTAQITFGQPDGMQVRYDQTGAGGFDSEPMIVPARQNFPQGGLYRVKLTNIPGRPGVELYPTIELAFSNPRTGAYLAHNSIPIQFTPEDFDQVVTGNFVTKVIYLPDPDFQGPALAGIDTLVSTRLDPGVDPIVEADRRGSILAIIRLGDKDIEMPGAGGLGIANGAILSPPIAGLPAPFAPAMTEGCGGPFEGGASGRTGTPQGLPGMISGISAPQYGMPITGTPIGLPGPPHIPLGTPAGLTKHVIRNHTPMHIPRPVDNVRIDVRHTPGYSYPNPVSRVRITEQNVNPGVPAGRGLYQHGSQRVP